MAQVGESDAIQNAGKKWQEAQKRGDQNGMKAAADEANRLRNQAGYTLDGGKANSKPTFTNGSNSGGSKNSGSSSSSKGYDAYIKNADGSYQMGKIINGTTYNADGSRLQNGQSVNDPQSGIWEMRDGKGVLTGGAYGTSYDPYRNGYDSQLGWGTQQFQPQFENPWGGYEDYSRQAYQEMLDQLEEQNRLAVQQGVNRLESNRGTLNQGYDETARQAYIAKMQSQKGLSQTLAGQGITGGGSESARLALETSYGNNINTNEQARQNALTGLDQSISDLRSTGDLNLVEQQLALQQQQLADSQNIYAQKISQDNWLKQFEQGNQQNEMQNYRDTIGAYAEDFTAEINRLLALGYSEDHQYIKELKAARSEKLAAMQSAEAAAYQQQFENQMLYDKTQYQIGKPYYNPRTGTSSKGSNKPRLTESQAHKAYYENGITTPEVVEALRFYYGNNVVSDREQESNALRNAGRGLGKVSR